MDDMIASQLGIAGSELLGATALTSHLIARFRVAFPLVKTWQFWLVNGAAGLFSSFVLMAMQGHEPTLQHAAYHVVLGILAAGGEPLLNRAHVTAEVRKNGSGRLGGGDASS